MKLPKIGMGLSWVAAEHNMILSTSPFRLRTVQFIAHDGGSDIFIIFSRKIWWQA
jgi:hypothetical protein